MPTLLTPSWWNVASRWPAHLWICLLAAHSRSKTQVAIRSICFRLGNAEPRLVGAGGHPVARSASQQNMLRYEARIYMAVSPPSSKTQKTPTLTGDHMAHT